MPVWELGSLRKGNVPSLGPAENLKLVSLHSRGHMARSYDHDDPGKLTWNPDPDFGPPGFQPKIWEFLSGPPESYLGFLWIQIGLPTDASPTLTHDFVAFCPDLDQSSRVLMNCTLTMWTVEIGSSCA